MARVILDADEASDESGAAERRESYSYTASLIIQGKHRFFTLSMPSDVLAETCVVDTRYENPGDGFQRVLDEKRARDIADYVDSGFGTIPSSIVLSAQPEAELRYGRTTRTLRFKNDPRAFLLLDGQHRVFGFRMAKSRLRVPVVIYNNLTKTEECRIFIDINTKQRPVPNELLLDIKRMAETETDVEALLRNVFDLFDKSNTSPLLGQLSPSERRRGKISRVTFNAALKPVWDSFGGNDAEYVYEALSGYLHAWISGLRSHEAERNIVNPTLFRAIMALFPVVAEKVSDRHGDEYTTANFAEILEPFFRRLRKADLQIPGNSHRVLYDTFRKALETGFSIGRRRA
jgi:DGQHR domain-containing protein